MTKERLGEAKARTRAGLGGRTGKESSYSSSWVREDADAGVKDRKGAGLALLPGLDLHQPNYK